MRRLLFISGILAISFGMRAYLAAQGGQYFFGDEGRHEVSVQLYMAVRAADITTIRAIVSEPGHVFSVLLGAGITAVQHLLAQLTAYGDWSRPENVIFTMWIGAVVLSTFYTLNLFWVYQLARSVGANDDESLWALVLAAATNTSLYHARHFLPYGCALWVALAALNIAIRRPTARGALLFGLLTGTVYHLYNGYWYLSIVMWIGYTWWSYSQPLIGRRFISASSGMALSLGLPVLVGVAVRGEEYWTRLFAFSRSVTQGLFSEGWSLPWEFFWHAEGFLGVSMVGCTMFVIVRARHRLPRHVRLWLLLLGTSYGLLVAFSTGLERFVVYGRTVLPFIPLFCLLGGWAVAQLLVGRRKVRNVLLVVIAFVTFGYFQKHRSLVFPREFEIYVLRNYGNPKHTLSISGSLYCPLALPISRSDLVLANTQLLYPIRDYIGFPSGGTLLELAHPLGYKPFQYESHTPRERNLLRTRDISMRLIQLSAINDLPDDLPFALRYQNSDRPTGR